jgi:hypothetical protein
MSFLDALKSQTARMDNLGFTENGAVTYKSSNSAVLDYFSKAGSGRNMDKNTLKQLVEAAAEEDLELTLKAVFWVRDVRGGAGEREVFRTSFLHLINLYGDALKPLIKYIPEYGRYDDLLPILNSGNDLLEYEALATITYGLRDRSKSGLAAKWIPSINSKNKVNRELALRISRFLGFNSPKEYRLFKSTLMRDGGVVEQLMSANEWDQISYSHVPSNASKLYRKAYPKHDKERYEAWLEEVKAGKKTVHSATLYPYELVNSIRHTAASSQRTLLNEQWKALPDYLQNAQRDYPRQIVPVCDVSGSMSTGKSPEPIDVCISLGLYVAERNVGTFQDHFITFSTTPTLQKIKGEDLYERVHNLNRAQWSMSTDIEAVFDLILKTGQRAGLTHEQMPDVVLIMSDMEFNSAKSNGESQDTLFETIAKKFDNAGYEMPKCVFWNLGGHNGKNNQPVLKESKNATLISGFSPAILKSILAGELETPYGSMLDVLNSERYAPITLA